MPHEILNVSVLNGSDSCHSPLLGFLASFPQIRVQDEARDPEGLLAQKREREPDLIIVDLDDKDKLHWLDDLSQNLPQAMVMVCSHNCERDFLIQVIQLGAREFLCLPPVQADFEAALERVAAAKRRRLSSDHSPGQMVVVTGLKGGMGATSVAVNIAITLAETHPDQVALVDLGRPYPDISKYLDQEQQNGLADLAGHLDKLDAAFVAKLFHPHEARIAVLHGCANFSDWQYLDPAAMDKFWVILRRMFAWIVVDLGHWPDELYLGTLQEADKVLFLVDVMIPNLKNTKKLCEMLQKAGVAKEKIKFVVNRYDKGNGNGLALDNLERSQPGRIISILPNDFPALSRAINHGVPLAEAAPRSKLRRSFQNLTKALVELCQPKLETKPSGQSSQRRRFLFF